MYEINSSDIRGSLRCLSNLIFFSLYNVITCCFHTRKNIKVSKRFFFEFLILFGSSPV